MVTFVITLKYKSNIILTLTISFRDNFVKNILFVCILNSKQ